MSAPNQWRKSRHLPVLASRPDLFYGRLEVDVGNTAFNEGKEFRFPREYTFSATPLVFKFVAPVDFVLQRQFLSCDSGNVRFRAYRAEQGAETGTFATPEEVVRNNSTQTAKDLDPLVTITSGGGFTPNEGEVPKEVLRIRSSGATAQKTSVSGAVGDERGLAAGTYYLMLQRIDGNETATGVYEIKWEERRPDE